MRQLGGAHGPAVPCLVCAALRRAQPLEAVFQALLGQGLGVPGAVGHQLLGHLQRHCNLAPMRDRMAQPRRPAPLAPASDLLVWCCMLALGLVPLHGACMPSMGPWYLQRRMRDIQGSDCVSSTSSGCQRNPSGQIR